MHPENGGGYSFGRFTLNLDRAALQADGVAVDLRPKSFDVLRYLVERAGRVVSKDEVVAAVWPNVFVSDDSLAQCIRDIRKALNDDGEQFIRTVPRRGYLFVADVEPLGQSMASARRDVPAEASARGRWPMAVLTGASFAIVLTVLAAWGGGWFASAPVPSARDARLTIAVLPFAHLGDNPGEEWLADGIAEDIMTAVSRFRDLTVIARNSSFRFRGDVDAREVGKQLNADYLLHGSVRRSGDRLRITAQLVDSRTGASRWAERYDRPFADVFAIQDEVAESVAGQLVMHAREAAVERLRSRPPEHMEAYELALRGRKAYRTFTRAGMIEARALAERAIAIDPNYPAVWEVLAAALLQFYFQPYDEHQGTPAMLQQARAAAEKAVSLDANFATAQAMLAAVLVQAREYDVSLERAHRAVSLNPNDSVALGVYGNVLTFAGQHREAVESWERAERIDPFIPAINLALNAIPHVMLHQFDQALSLTRSCAQRAPKLLPCFTYLAVAANELGLKDEAGAAVRRVLELDPKYSTARRLTVLPFRSEADAARMAESMRRAGLPE